jgi:uncharacterized protein DUF2334
MYFCIRDDDTNFFTSPEELERAYGEISQWGPISLAVVPFHRAGTSKAIPEKYRGRWSIHPLHENRPLVEYLRIATSNGQFEIMLHGYYHDEPSGQGELLCDDELAGRITDGRKYLEDLMSAPIRVFVPPHNTIGPQGLRAIALAGLHLGCTAGVRSGWPLLSYKTWSLWLRLRRWEKTSGLGIPWILDLGDHREIAGNPVTPSSSFQRNNATFASALALGGVFCAATHYWEKDAPSIHAGEPTPGDHLRYLVDRARSDPRVTWRTVGDTISTSWFVA